MGPLRRLVNPVNYFENRISNERVVMDWWKSTGIFDVPIKDADEIFILPPPNITGTLHFGHALTSFLQDALIRHRRQLGKSIAWIPGLDHAGISTQSVVEKHLMATKNLRRIDMSRAQWDSEILAWKAKSSTNIIEQLSRFGLSVNWNALYFTLDPQKNHFVSQAFIKLFNDGLIYRDNRMIHYCPFLQTTLSDIEIEHREIQGGQHVVLPGRQTPVTMGILYAIKMTVADSSEIIEVQTSRPETCAGDVAIAVHPEDERYRHLIGKFVFHPLLCKRLPIVGDAELINPDFGSGIAKITPSCDPADYQASLRHKLPLVDVSDAKGDYCVVHLKALQISPKECLWQDRFDLRRRIVDYLTDKKLISLHKTAMSLPFCARSGDLLEYRVFPQWYLRCEPLALLVKDRIIQENFVMSSKSGHEQLLRWLDSAKDWCISRQLWWGHEIPAFERNAQWVAASDLSSACQLFGTTQNVKQDPDVLDTWFSSSLLPLSSQLDSLGSAINSKTYPLPWLETGADILFFWVARMMMLCTYLSKATGALPTNNLDRNYLLPFKKVILHPVLRDSTGQKISKSLGNSIDPISVIEGQRYDELLKSTVANLKHEGTNKAAFLADLSKKYPNGLPSSSSDALRHAILSRSLDGSFVSIDTAESTKMALSFHLKVENTFRIAFQLLRDNAFQVLTISSTRASVCVAANSDPISVFFGNLSCVPAYIFVKSTSLLGHYKDRMESLNLHSTVLESEKFLREVISGDYIPLLRNILLHSSLSLSQNAEYLTALWFSLYAFLVAYHPFSPCITEVLFSELLQFSPATQNKLGKDKEFYYSLSSDHSDFLRMSTEIASDAKLDDSGKLVFEIIRAIRQLKAFFGKDMSRVQIYINGPVQAFNFEDFGLDRLLHISAIQFFKGQFRLKPSDTHADEDACSVGLRTVNDGTIVCAFYPRFVVNTRADSWKKMVHNAIARNSLKLNNLLQVSEEDRPSREREFQCLIDDLTFSYNVLLTFKS